MMLAAEAERRRGNAAAGSFFHPFTPSQLQELHGQAIIFNCVSLGLPIPSHLLHSLGRSRISQPKPGFFPHHSPMEWGCRQMGSSGREEDPEPGRCRRTDGKKWRCSRVACPDSKYCERHLHRGKNRSRKQLESSLLHPIATTSSPCPMSLLPPIIQSKRTAREDLRFCDGGKENGGVEQDSSSGTSSLSFQHCFVMGADLSLEGPVKTEKTISLHRFFDERPENERRDADLQRSDSQDPMPFPLPPLLDLNV